SRPLRSGAGIGRISSAGSPFSAVRSVPWPRWKGTCRGWTRSACQARIEGIMGARRCKAEGGSVRGRPAAPDIEEVDDGPLPVEVEENPPVADSAAPNGRLVLKPSDVPGERVLTHGVKGSGDALPILPVRPHGVKGSGDALPILPVRPLKRFSCSLSDADVPAHGGAARGSRNRLV